MNPAKIRLSAKEMELVVEPGWILTKNEILRKMQLLLAAELEQQQAYISAHAMQLPVAVTRTPGKISKGENYRGLPYLVLDHPRCFEKENIFLIRSMFWWGNFFSVTLYLTGKYKKMYEQAILRSFPLLQQQEKSICVNEDPWEHHFGEDNYLPLKSISKEEFEKMILEKTFIKIANKTALENLSFGEGWKDFITILSGT